MSVSSQTRGCNAEMVVFLEGKVEQLERELVEAKAEIERMRPVVEQVCSDIDHWRIHGYVYSMDDLSDCCVEYEYERFKKEER
jgi:hypothetical protein